MWGIFSQQKEDLKELILKVLREGLEGLVLKDINVSIELFVYHKHIL